MYNSSLGNTSGSPPLLWSMYVNPFDLTHIRVIFILLYGLVFLACVVGNIMVILVIIRHRKMRNITNFFLVNLAASDLCVGVFCILPNLASYMSTEWYLGRVMCKLYYFVQCVSYTSSIIILTVISLERYLAIIYPMLSKRISRMCLVKVTTLVVWIITLGYGVPVLIGYDTVDVVLRHNNTTMSFCVKKRQFKMEPYILMNFVLWYVIPLFLMTLMYSKISVVLWKSSFIGQELQNTAARRSKQRPEMHPLKDLRTQTSCTDTSDLDTVDRSGVRIIITNGEGEVTQSAVGVSDCSDLSGEDIKLRQGEDNPKKFENLCSQMRKKPRVENRLPGNENAYNDIRKMTRHKVKKSQEISNPMVARRKVIRLLIAIVVSFAVCVLPYHIRLLWQTFNAKPHFSFSDMLAPPITFLIFYLNSCLNPFLYAFLSDNFRKAFWELRWCKTPHRHQGSPLTSKSHNTMSTHKTNSASLGSVTGHKPYAQDQHAL